MTAGELLTQLENAIARHGPQLEVSLRDDTAITSLVLNADGETVSPGQQGTYFLIT